MAALLARQGDAPALGPVSSVLDFIVHTLLRIGRARLAGSAELLGKPPAPPEPLPWALQLPAAEQVQPAEAQRQAAHEEAVAGDLSPGAEQLEQSATQTAGQAAGQVQNRADSE